MPKKDNVFQIFRINDGSTQSDVFLKRSSPETSEKEFKFLSWAKSRIIHGDLNGVPLILSDLVPVSGSKGRGAQMGFFTPDYGITLNRYVKNSTFVDKSLLGLSILATLCSISCVNTDLHDRNICIFRPEILFRYVWTIRIACHLFEISWVANGMIATIDWEYTKVFPRLSCFTSSGSSYSPLLWELDIRSFPQYGLTFSGQFIGERGMAVVLNHVLTSFDNSLYEIKYRGLVEYGTDTNVTSLLEVFPTENPKGYSFDDATKLRWNRVMSTRGKNFKTQKYLTEEDISCIRGLYVNFSNYVQKPYHDIPSDTGLVVLTKDGHLTATNDIPTGTIITCVPLTKCETFSNPRVWIGPIQGTVIKKAWPFCGFGGFARWDDESKSNCRMKTVGSYIALVATKPISKGDTVVCFKNWVERPCSVDVKKYSQIKAIVNLSTFVSSNT